jgi:hypothetical protein
MTKDLSPQPPAPIPPRKSPPFVSNIPSRAGSGNAEPMVDGYNLSSLN